MLLIPVVVVIGGILALVLYLKKKDLHPIEGRPQTMRARSKNVAAVGVPAR